MYVAQLLAVEWSMVKKWMGSPQELREMRELRSWTWVIEVRKINKKNTNLPFFFMSHTYTLFSVFIFCLLKVGQLWIPRDIKYLLETGKEAGAKLHSASWGGKALSYDKMTRDVDDYIYKNQDFLLIVAAGNSGSGGKAQTIMSPAQAKNALTGGLMPTYPN